MDSSLNQLLNVQFESVRLQNRVARLIDVDICCLDSDKTLAVILRSKTPAEASHLCKNIDGFAFQLRQRLDVDGDKLEFIHWNQAADEPQCQRWRFTWVGTSPVKPIVHDVPFSLLQKALHETRFAPVTLSDKSGVATTNVA